MTKATKITESVAEDATLQWLEELGYETIFGPEIAPGEPGAERTDYAEVTVTDDKGERLSADGRDVMSDEVLRPSLNPAAAGQ